MARSEENMLNSDRRFTRSPKPFPSFREPAPQGASFDDNRLVDRIRVASAVLRGDGDLVFAGLGQRLCKLWEGAVVGNRNNLLCFDYQLDLSLVLAHICNHPHSLRI